VNCVIGDLDVTLSGSHSYNSDLVVTLVGPDGQRYQLQNHSRANPFRRYSVRRAVGHTSAGQWQIIVRDDVRADSGQLTGWSLQLRCQ
jgi:subtilisin-like proprotein convertase family protein